MIKFLIINDKLSIIKFLIINDQVLDFK